MKYIPIYSVVTYRVIAPQSGGGKFRRPVDIVNRLVIYQLMLIRVLII